VIPNLVIPVLNRYDLLQRAISSVDFEIRSLLIVDNGQGPTEEIAISDAFADVTYLPLPSNLGVSASWNLGVKLFPHDSYWLFSSNDAVFKPGALEEFSETGPDDVLLSPNFPRWQTFSVGENVIRNVGLFSEDLYPAYFEDDDFTMRVENAGFQLRRIETEVEHDNSSTLRAEPSFQYKNEISFANNRKRLAERRASGETGPGLWSLDVRRTNDWTKELER
jgi:GT2 family glycosyltransferase